MEKKNVFETSNEIIELPNVYEDQARNLATQLTINSNKNLFLEIDCAPNGHLNPFHYRNGLGSVRTLLEINHSFLGSDQAWLEKRIAVAAECEPDYSLAEKIGLWKRVNENNFEELIDWSLPFCVKNYKGVTKIWHPQWRKFFHLGFATRSSIIKFIKEEKAYVQPFHLPLSAINNIYWRMTYRLIFFCSPGSEPEFIGGFWISRVGFKIYPSKDSILGLISSENN